MTELFARHTMSNCSRLARITVLLAVVTAAAVAQPVERDPAIENARQRLWFDPQNGGLVQVEHRKKGRELLEAGTAAELWSIEFMDGGSLSPRDARTFAWKTNEAGSAITLQWSDFDRKAAPNLAIVASVSLSDESPVSHWAIRVEGLGSEIVRGVSYPRIGPVADLGDETLAAPRWIGEMTRSARRLLNPGPSRGERWTWDYPGEMSMQFVTFYGDDGTGLMLSTNDTQLSRKRFAVLGDGANGLLFEVVHYAAIEHERQSHYAPDYEVVLRLTDGDWYTAAEHYRRWAQKQWWMRDSRVKRGLTPQWVRDTGLWVWNRGRSPHVLQPATKLKQYANLPVSVFWHWWHGCAYDVGFPEYLPPREGDEAFRNAVAEAESQGVRAIVYMNQRLWGMTTKSWTDRNAAAFAVKKPDGTIEPEVYNTFVKAPCASMCIATPFWRKTYANLAEAAVRDLGVAGIYMDQACTSLGCYDPSHGHTLGGGGYWMDGFKLLEADIRQRTKNIDDVALAGEGCGEAWLPYLDMMLSLQVSLERYAGSTDWEPVPLFNAVYHDCSTQYGNYSSLTRPPYDDLWPAEFAPKEPLALLDEKFATQFRLEQGRSFVWGQQPTLANFRDTQLTSRANEIEYLLRLARMRRNCLKYLRDGVFLRPPEFEAPQADIPMSRLSIYAGQQDAVQETTKTVPLVVAGAWLAPDGDIGVAITNISTEPKSVRVKLDRDRWPLGEHGVVYRRTDRKREECSRFEDGSVTLDVELDDAGVQFFEIVDARADE